VRKENRCDVLTCTVFHGKIVHGCLGSFRDRKYDMFKDTSGSISPMVCMSLHVSATTLAVHQYSSEHTNPDRELIAHMLVSMPSTPAISPTIAGTKMCLQCDTFAKSGRVSCCAPGGAWHENCGGAGYRNADYTWFEGMKDCKPATRTTSSTCPICGHREEIWYEQLLWSGRFLVWKLWRHR